MQSRRAALPLSLLALLASAGCVCVGQQADVPGPARGSIPPLGTPDAPDASDGHRAADRRPVQPLPLPLPLPLGELPEPEPTPTPAPAAPLRKTRPAAVPSAKHAPSRRLRAPKPAVPRAPRQAAPRLPHGEDLCGAAEGAVPPSIVDLCVRQYGR